VAPCHCSGDHLIRQFHDAFGSNFLKVGTGSILNFD
jgi:metal-dependent hydrolase (beta-lactamase superfamily II)